MSLRALARCVPAVLTMYSDIHCPYAYLAAFRLRRALRDTGSAVEVRHASLAIEYLDSKATPKGILDAETPYIVRQEPDLPWQPWSAPMSEWPVTMWPAFEAVKTAETQGWRVAHELDWALRHAFFARSRCIAMRHVILELARGVEGLDVRRFEEEWDAGTHKGRVLREAREGWEALGLEASPTFVLPDGSRHANPASLHVVLGDAPGHAVVRVEPSPEPDARGFFRRMVEACA